MNKMSKTILLIILIWGLLITGCSAGSEPSEVRLVGQAPEFQLEDLDGQSVSLSDFQGKPVLLNFWATWCSPCRSEMPYLQEIYEEWSSQGLVMLTINIGESHSKVSNFLQTYNLSLPVLLDTKSSVAQEYNITGIPTTLFIDKDGVIQQKIIGAFPSKESIEKNLNAIMP